MIRVESVNPTNDHYGLYEGTPIARYYIDGYMSSVSTRLFGLILEFGWPTYSKYIECTYEILDIDRTNPQATIYGDICDVTLCRPLLDRYDCIICTTVLQLVSEPQTAVDNMRMMLKPGGTLIVAEKAVSRIDPWSATIDRWRFTQHGLEHLLRGFSNVDIHHRGNVYAICAYMLGLPAEQIDTDKLQYTDPHHPIVVIAHAEK
jgi:SAM-dependent methyltransferase